MSVSQKINTMTKPSSKLKFINIAPIISSGLSEATETRKSFIRNNSDNIKRKKDMSMIEFIRLYKIGNVPIMDFFFTYIILYVANKLYTNIDNKYIIIGTVPITLLIDIILDDKITPSVLITIIFILSIFYLAFNIDIKKNNMYI